MKKLYFHAVWKIMLGVTYIGFMKVIANDFIQFFIQYKTTVSFANNFHETVMILPVVLLAIYAMITTILSSYDL